MLDPQASRFWQAALLSGLMDVDGLTACWNAIPPAKRSDPAHLDRRLARQAVQSRALTLWQAQQLLAGRTGGFQVDRYVLLDLIGQGGMGRVYLARDPRLNRRVALKILAPERINNPRAIARFQREARVGAQLQHENLVRVYDFGQSHGRYYLVMEYIEGKTIGTLISEQGPMPPTTAARLAWQVALGLGHAHRKGLIHRDVNPYNILVTHDGTAKLADLGLAVDLAESDRVTREGATVGTFDYVAPEQARRSADADIRSDIYSLGCTLYHMLAGRVPFPSPSLPEKLFAHQALEPTPLEQLVPGLPVGLAEVIRTMMRKSPAERYATPMQVAQALEPYAEEYLGVGGRADTPRWPPRGGAAPSPRPGEPMGAAVAGAPTVRTPVTTSPRSQDAEAAAPRGAAEPRTDGAAPAPGATPDAGADEPTIPLLTPVDEADEGDPEIPLLLDLGPEPPLGAGLAQSRSRFASIFAPGSTSGLLPDESGSGASTSEGSAWRPVPGWLWGFLALAVLATALVVLLGLAGAFRPIPRGPREPAGRHPAGSPGDRATEAHRPRWTGPGGPAIVVRAEGREGDPEEEGTPAADLVEAMRAAMAIGGYIELRNRTPLRLAAGQTLDCDTGWGRLIIRAARGITPVLDVELSGPRPLVATGSNVSVELSGLTIIVRYPSPGTNPSPAPPPLIRAAGAMMRIERCAFQAAGPACRPGSRAVVVEGGSLTVDRCWFQGFDRAIEVSACNGSISRVEQTMIVPAPGSAPSPSPAVHGWGVKVRTMPGGRPRSKTTRRLLILDHCTVEGAGLLDAAGGRVPSPLEVEVKHCAVRTAALLACDRDKPATAQVSWRGEGNQYDIRGHSWIILVGHPGSPAASTDVTDLESWSKVAVRESEPIRTKIVYRTDLTARSNPLRPRDFAIADLGWPPIKVGADPEQVGPWRR